MKRRILIGMIVGLSLGLPTMVVQAVGNNAVFGGNDVLAEAETAAIETDITLAAEAIARGEKVLSNAKDIYDVLTSEPNGPAETMRISRWIARDAVNKIDEAIQFNRITTSPQSRAIKAALKALGRSAKSKVVSDDVRTALSNLARLTSPAG